MTAIDPVEAAKKVSERLEGTCDSIPGILEQLDFDPGLEDDTAFCAELDQNVFCCLQCEWWFEQSGNDDPSGTGWLCDECFGERFEE